MPLLVFFFKIRAVALRATAQVKTTAPVEACAAALSGTAV
jgi:hypothetical protein